MLTFANLPMTPEQRAHAIRSAEAVFRLHGRKPEACWPHVVANGGDRDALRAWYAAETAAIRAIARSWREIPPGARMDWEPAA